MSLSDEATMTLVWARPTALTVTWTALTVRPLSGPATGICSLSTSETTPTVTWVFGATLVVETTVLPTWRKAIVVVPVDPPQVVVDVDWTALSVIVGIAGIATVASATDALAVDLPGKATVVTLAHSTCALT